MIESVNNERIKEYSKLNVKKYRDQTGLFIVEGEHLVEEALKNNIVKEIFSLDDRPNSTKVSVPVMEKLSNLSTIPKVVAVCKKIESASPSGNILVLDGIQDPGNLGTIIRSAVAFGVNTIVSSTDTVDIYNIKVLRATEGMIFNINYVVEDLDKFLPTLEGYTIYGTNVVNGTKLNNLTIKEPYALIIGNEGNGVRDNIKPFIKENVYIPMNKACESLNAGVATSIILYEFYKN